MKWTTAALAAVLSLTGEAKPVSKSKPNIIMIMTDDQDLHLDSTEHMPTLQKLLVQRGTTFNNHWVTEAQCCPSRATVLRGQQAHNTNITAVSYPGGNYDKWRASEMDSEYLPKWLNDAGYSTNYIGKFLNGHNLGNYNPPPKAWTEIDALIDPYMYDFNRAVFSKNGQHPVNYPGWHQPDIVRIKAVERIKQLAQDDKPFFYWISPTAPHTVPPINGPSDNMPQPLTRHKDLFPDLVLPKKGNWNPPDEYAKQKVNWVGRTPPLNESMLAETEVLYKTRIQSLQGIDEIIEDVVATLEQEGILDNTYIIYTSDNGFMIGTHRITAMKSLAYKEAGQTPFIVRGPGVPEGVVSRLPGTHTDIAPTLLELAGVDPASFPKLFDGRSLLPQWREPAGSGNCSQTSPVQTECSGDVIGVEFWGDANYELPALPFNDPQGPYGAVMSSFKALRVAGEHRAYLYTVWCSNELELYNTLTDPDELVNLALNPDAETRRLMTRLNALLLVIKSCEGDVCRAPWQAFANDTALAGLPSFSTLDDALDPRLDDYFASLPGVHFDACLQAQVVANEWPFYPEAAAEGLGTAWRVTFDDWSSPAFRTRDKVPANAVPAGSVEQRTATFADLLAAQRDLTGFELGQ
ncbi:hypothetical protein MCOR31_011668 [Pyricularia oryzae]|nr:hypothetical protein MCOR31_011668 [Pyricularia oryzae]